MFVHELEEQWASALSIAPLEANDIFQSEIKRAARELTKQGRGQFMFDYQLSNLSTHWRDDELEETVWVEPPPYVPPKRRVR